MKTWMEPPLEPPPLPLQQLLGGHPLIAQVMARRGFHEPESARAFLDPEAYTPHSPFELPGMQPAVERLEQALRQEEIICVWGDFDVDGQTATTVLVSALRRLGGRVVYHIPLRGRIARRQPGSLAAGAAGGGHLRLWRLAHLRYRHQRPRRPAIRL